MLIRLLWGLVRYFRIKKYESGNELIVSTEKPLKGLFRMEQTARGDSRLIPEQNLLVQLPHQKRPRLIAAETPVTIPSDVDSERFIQIQPEGLDQPVFTITDIYAPTSSEEEPEISCYVKEGAHFDDDLSVVQRTIGYSLLLGICSCVVAMRLHRPDVLTIAQWIYDVVVPIS